MKEALIIIDIQNDYFPGGAMELEGPLQAGENAKKALEFFRETGRDLAHIQHLSVRPNATFFLPDTEGVNIHEVVSPAPGETIVKKYFPNSFRETELLDFLRGKGITRLIICGMMSHMCVDATTRAAFDLGFECVLIGDACATRRLVHQGVTVPAEHVHASFMAALNGVYAKVITVDEYVKEAAE